MSNFYASINLDDNALEKLGKIIENKIGLTIDEKITQHMEDNFDAQLEDVFEAKLMDYIDNKIEEFLDEKLDDKIDSYLSISYDFLDDVESALDRINLNDYLDDSTFLTENDVVDVMTGQLLGYRPSAACNLGNAFLDAVHESVLYQLKKFNLAQDIKKALDQIVINGYMDSIKKEIIEEYSAMLENQKLSVSESSTSNNGYSISNITTEVPANHI